MESASACKLCDGGRHGTLYPCKYCDAWFGESCLLKKFIRKYIFEDGELYVLCPTVGCPGKILKESWSELIRYYELFKQKNRADDLKKMSRFFWNAIFEKDRAFIESLEPVLGHFVVMQRQPAGNVEQLLTRIRLARRAWTRWMPDEEPGHVTYGRLRSSPPRIQAMTERQMALYSRSN